jgi:DNA-binding winged helix-turn-helix (wHTH) protein
MTAGTDRPDFKFPVDLAREADFGLGASLVSPSTREVLRGAERETLEPRVMQVLVALFQANGRVVSRDELIARCWEGRVVGEDAINRAIGRLRRLSEVDREASFVIETIPRVGYRLIPASSGHVSPPIVAETGSPEAVAQPENVPAAATGAQSHRWLIAGGLILVGLAGSIAAWLFWPARHWTVESSRPFVSTLALEGEPAFSPDGKMLAYASGADVLSRKIYVRNLAGGDGIKVISDAYDDVSPSWSSDGARIAYVAQKTGHPCRIMVVTVPAGEAREAGRCTQAETSSVTWQPGTQFVYYTDQLKLAGSVIVRLDLGTGARLQVAALNQAETILGQLRCSPDGKSLLYIRQQFGAPEPVVVRDLASGIEKTLGETTGTTGSNGSAAWSEDSQTVLVTLPSGIGTKIIAHPVAGRAAYSVYATATIASHLALGGGLLALETDNRRANLARASMAPAAQPDIIDPANGINVYAHFRTRWHTGLYLQPLGNQCRLDHEAGRGSHPAVRFRLAAYCRRSILA